MTRSLVAVALTFLFATACRTSDARDAVPPARIRVRTAPVVLAALDEPAIGAGVVASHDEFPLAFKISGVVAAVHVREGDVVRAGQTLAQLQDAATALELARADLQTASVNRRYAAVVAPSAGRVLRRAAEPGQTLAAGAPVLTIGGSTGGTVLRVGLPDRDIVRVRVGSPATVRLDAFPDRVLTGRVRQIAGAATAGSGTYAVEIALDDATGLSVGMIGSTTIAATGRGSLPTVPVDALLEADGDRASVFVVSGGRARRRAVRVATIQGDRVAVREGLAGDTSVVVTGATYLDDGAAVTVLP